MNREQLERLAQVTIEGARRGCHCDKCVLAHAVETLLSWARHLPGCASSHPIDIYEDPLRYLPCDCGLDKAIEEIQ